MTQAAVQHPSASTTSEQAKAGEEATSPTVAEFFAGIGLARMGLERAGFRVVWANDIEETKRETYLGHFKDSHSKEHYKLADIADIAQDPSGENFPPVVSLAWASFPCTDLSLAGDRRGLAGKHSRTFWHFTDILERSEDLPPVVAIENVNGFATSHRGADLRAAVKRLGDLGYWVDVLTLDARSWVPQSRPRLFLVASLKKAIQEVERDYTLRPHWLDHVFDDSNLRTQRAFIPSPPLHKTTGWTELVEEIPIENKIWWNEERTAKFIEQLSEIQLKRVSSLQETGLIHYRTAYRRTRDGKPAWEIRADDIAGCLRTARGGSSKQAVVRMERGTLHVRWMTRLEYARLMGAGEYTVPERDSQAVMGFGDAVCVDAVEWLAKNYLEPLLKGDLLIEGVETTPAL
ncbi:DNA (cytosine-5-)-methyltransferase [Sphaerisporangium krabiense]|uniref:DNA (cytosine-5-)-methyltransferase n=1 Tax=Sphaerisporangium krabiense TaxID=763782 RepID=A0A7W9DQM1_9ACTN|nr:DNA cytosine methyltransferase [Sphaerisporangium krabiense]MBB5626575.1 DNA (cytosine-5)-methyltransferase 1 [Sphaerisporangium krabiense]GII63497.1 DNA (cytosine-5-)-methyltransferase [Sphaerisporangium krabiense]